MQLKVLALWFACVEVLFVAVMGLVQPTLFDSIFFAARYATIVDPFVMWLQSCVNALFLGFAVVFATGALVRSQRGGILLAGGVAKAIWAPTLLLGYRSGFVTQQAALCAVVDVALAAAMIKWGVAGLSKA